MEEEELDFDLSGLESNDSPPPSTNPNDAIGGGDFDLSDLGMNNNQSVATGQTSNLDINAYEPYMKGRGTFAKSNVDFIRAENQSGWEQAGLAFARIPQNFVGGMVSDVGYMAELFAQGIDPENDFNNWMIDAGEWIKKNNVANYLTKNNQVKNLAIGCQGFNCKSMGFIAEMLK